MLTVLNSKLKRIFKLSEPINKSIAHVGAFDFPMSWEDWYRQVGEILNWKINFKLLKGDISSLHQLNSFDLVRLVPEQAQRVAPLFKASAPLISTMKYADIVYKKKASLWPHISHKEAVHSVILDKYPKLNTKGAGLIVGESPQAIVAARTLVELGIKHITFVLDNVTETDSFLQVVGQSLFEVHLEVIQKDQVILLPGIYSVMICYYDLKEEKELLEGLLFFSYLMHGGLIIMNTTMDLAPLREEASAIGAKVVDSVMLQVHDELMALRTIVPLHQDIKKRLEEIIPADRFL